MLAQGSPGIFKVFVPENLCLQLKLGCSICHYPLIILSSKSQKWNIRSNIRLYHGVGQIN